MLWIVSAVSCILDLTQCPLLRKCCLDHFHIEALKLPIHTDLTSATHWWTKLGGKGEGYA